MNKVSLIYEIDKNSTTYESKDENQGNKKGKIIRDYDDGNIIILNEISKDYSEAPSSSSNKNDDANLLISEKIDKKNNIEYLLFEDKIKQLIYSNKSILSGNYYNYEEYFRALFDEDKIKSISWIRKLLQMNYYNNDKIIVAILHLFSHFEYSEIGGDDVWSMVSTLFSHENIKIQKFALKTFDNWNESTTIPILKGSNIRIKWLDDYRLSIIERLERVF